MSGKSREREAPVEPRVIIGNRQTKRLRGSVALPGGRVRTIQLTLDARLSQAELPWIVR